MSGVKSILGVLLACSLVLVSSPSIMALEIGEKAPDFELESTKGGKLKLADLRGKNILINFYRADFDPT